jgi:oligosaccharyltransferase complex subunit beta
LIAFPRGVGQTLDSNSALLSPILRAPETAYAYNPKDSTEQVDDSFATGTQLSLITALQARNNARFVVLGSVELLANEWFDAKVKLPTSGAMKEKTANRDFAQALSAWTFQELGVLKVGKIEHHLAETPNAKSPTSGPNVSSVEKNPKIYRVKNEVVRSSLTLPSQRFSHTSLRGPSGGHCVELQFLSPLLRKLTVH